jgi:hypothetical protein
MDHFLECHNKIKANEFRATSCFRFEELRYGHCCLSIWMKPDYGLIETLEYEHWLHKELFMSAMKRYSEVINLDRLTRFELKVAATFMNVCVDELDMEVPLPRDLLTGENAEGALNFFECECLGRDTSKRFNMMYEKKGPFPKDPEGPNLTDS